MGFDLSVAWQCGEMSVRLGQQLKANVSLTDEDSNE
jgi:hypothetical protein